MRVFAPKELGARLLPRVKAMGLGLFTNAHYRNGVIIHKVYVKFAPVLAKCRLFQNAFVGLVKMRQRRPQIKGVNLCNMLSQVPVQQINPNTRTKRMTHNNDFVLGIV